MANTEATLAILRPAFRHDRTSYSALEETTMRKNLKRTALTEEKSRPGKTGAMPQEMLEALPIVS